MGANKSKYYYDYTRNMSEEKKINECNCERKLSVCNCLYSEEVQDKIEEFKKEESKSNSIEDTDAFFDAWTKSLEEQEQPTCNIENQEDCENCGS